MSTEQERRWSNAGLGPGLGYKPKATRRLSIAELVTICVLTVVGGFEIGTLAGRFVMWLVLK